MGAVERVTVELPAPVAARLHERVASGEFASESVAVAEALLALDMPAGWDTALDAWIVGPVADAYRDWKDGRLTTVSVDTLAAQIDTDRAEDARRA